MTMLVSLFAAEGIVFAADSAITYVERNGRSVRHEHGHRTKVMPVHGLGIARGGGVVGYWGLAQVSGRPMAEWLKEVADGWLGSRTVEEFARQLSQELARSTNRREREIESGFHVAGFEERDGRSIPVCWVVRNRDELDTATGLYRVKLPSWDDVREHLPCGNLEHIPLDQLRLSLRRHQAETGVPFWFRNGDLRDFSKPFNAIETAVRQLVAEPRFTAPTDLRRWERLAKSLVATAGALYGIYYASGASPIEGRATTVSIAWP